MKPATHAPEPVRRIFGALPQAGARAAAGGALWQRHDYLRLMPEVQQKLLDNQVKVPNILGDSTSQSEKADLAQFITEVAAAIPETERGRAVPRGEAGQVARELAMWMLGVGLLTPYLDDPGVQDVIVHANRVDVRRRGRRVEVGAFADAEYFIRMMHRVCQVRGEDINQKKLLGVTSLPGDIRLTVIFPPLSQDGMVVYLRKHGVRHLSLEEMCATGSIDAEGAEFLRRIAGHASIMLSGAPGTGKTTLLNAITGHLPAMCNVALVETFKEVRPQTRRVAHLVPDDYDSNPLHSLRAIVNNLFSRGLIDLVIVGETTGNEAEAIVDGMNLGIPAMTTIHGKSPRSALTRLETLFLANNPEYSHAALRDRIGDTVDVVIQMARSMDGEFRVGEIAALDGYNARDGVYDLVSLKRYDRRQHAFTPMDPFAEEVLMRTGAG